MERSLDIGLTYDLKSDYLALGFAAEDVAEFDSAQTIDLLEQAIREIGHRTDRIGHARALCARLVAGERWDLVFNIAEGVRGRSREAQVPALLELYDIPYTMSDPLVCAATLDKAIAKRLARDAGLATSPFVVVREAADLEGLDLEYPLFAKPLAEGTGKGVMDRSLVRTPEELAAVCAELGARFRQPVLVEEYLPGREFTVGVLGTGVRARVLGCIEVVIGGAFPVPVYSYQNKQDFENRVQYVEPPADGLRGQVEALALAAHRTLECRDCSRVDLRLDRRGRPCFLEINPLPGINAVISDLPIIARQAGLSYAELIGGIIDSARERMEESR